MDFSPLGADSQRDRYAPLPRRDRLNSSTNGVTDPQRDRHRDSLLPLWDIQGWC